MTVSSITPVNNYTGNSSAKTFDFDFLIESQEELQVVHTNSNGIQTTLEFGVDYSINEIGNKNGSYITFPLEGSNFEVLSNEEIISLSLTLPIKQESEFENSANLNLNILERTFDYIVRILQIMNRKIERSVKTQEGSSITPDEIIEDLQKSAQNSKLYAEISSQKSQEAQNSASSALQSETGAQNVKEEILELSETVKADILTGINNYKSLGMYLQNGVLYYTKETGEVVPYVIGTQMPVGSLVQLACSSDYVPDGCLPCDGAEYSKSQFPDLWNVYLKGEIITDIWTTSLQVDSGSFGSVTYGNGKFVAVGGSGYTATSTDGETWTTPVTVGSGDWESVTYGNGKFVAVGANGYISASADGETWTTPLQVASGDFGGVTYANGKFVAVGNGGKTTTSEDGETWTTPVYVTSVFYLNSVTYGNGKFVAVGNDGKITTSEDGETWTTPVVFGNSNWYGVTYGNGKFVAVGLSGYAATSEDGETWAFSSHRVSGNWFDITYADGKFIAVGGNGKTIISTDGEIWTARAEIGTSTWQGVTYGNGKFVAVGIDGVIATSTGMLKINSLLNTCFYDDFASEIETYGQCGKFAVDTVNEKFKVPLIKDGAVIQQALSDSELGKAYNAGLPNIEGQMGITSAWANLSKKENLSGALYDADPDDKGGSPSNGSSSSTQTRSVGFDASLSNSIYGNSDTVQPNAVALRYFVVVTNGQINESMMDWSAWASNLQSKVNTDLSNFPKPYVTEMYENGSSGYVLYSNGYCEQWGKAERNEASDTVTLLKPYKNADYNLQISPYHTSLSTDGRPPLIYETSKTADSFVFNLYTSYVGVYWKTSGYVS